MTLTSRVQANRENAKRSAVPKTPEGKAASSKNASTHGLSSTFRVPRPRRRRSLRQLGRRTQGRIQARHHSPEVPGRVVA